MNKLSSACKWTLENDDWNIYNTSCSNSFCIEEGMPKGNGFNYCIYCGKELEEDE